MVFFVSMRSRLMFPILSCMLVQQSTVMCSWTCVCYGSIANHLQQYLSFRWKWLYSRTLTHTWMHAYTHIWVRTLTHGHAHIHTHQTMLKNCKCFVFSDRRNAWAEEEENVPASPFGDGPRLGGGEEQVQGHLWWRNHDILLVCKLHWFKNTQWF